MYYKNPNKQTDNLQFQDNSLQSHIEACESHIEATNPPLPDRLDKLIDQPWTPEASAAIDKWVWYMDQEWLGVVR